MSPLNRLLATAREVMYGRRVPRLKATRDAVITTIVPPSRVRLTITGLDPVVEPGQAIEGGHLVARTPETSRFQRRVHASLTGTVTAVSQDQIILTGLVPDRPPITHNEPEWIAPAAIADTAREAGLVGMGGAMFPSYVKLSGIKPIEVVLVNGCESEPYRTCDHRVLEEQRDAIDCGLRLAMHSVGAERGLVIDHETHYPGGYERLLIDRELGRVVPPRGLPRDVGAMVMNAQSVLSLHEAVCLGRPLIDRVVTIDGGAVGRPGNYRVPIGTEVGHLLDVCQVDRSKAARILTSGPMLGEVASETTPVTGGIGCVLALTSAEVAAWHPQPCIRCGRCMEACPFDLPVAHLVETPHKAVLACIECGACQFSCPAHRPLVDGLQKAKAEVTEWD